MKNKHLYRNWLILIFLVVVAFVALKSYQDFLLSSVDIKNTKEQRFVVYKGDATSDIAKRLEKEGLIRSVNAFMLLVRTSGEAEKIQAGDFKLSPSMSGKEILQELTVGVQDMWVTLLEGWRIEEMAEKLNKELGTPNQAFIEEAEEGYMFPDTYLLSPKATPLEIVQVLRKNFEKKYDPELQEKIKALSLTPNQGVILASIVEREARSNEARRMVVSILLKRFKIGMGLNADATVQYALGYQANEKSWWKRHLTREDLKIDSPYNTYLYRGLPPAPISNPSLSSLQAVASADSSTDYLYYYHDSKGNSHYAKTLEEHNDNITRYP